MSKVGSARKARRNKVLVVQPWGGDEGVKLVTECANRLDLDCEYIEETLPEFRWKNVVGKIILWYGPCIKAAVRGIRRRRGQDVILCCNPMSGLLLGAAGRLMRMDLPPVVISMFLFRNWTPEFMDKLRHLFADYALKKVDRIICFSSFEVDRYKKEFPRHAEKLTFVPVGADPTFLDLAEESRRVSENPPMTYIFSGGTTNRDYVTLMKAMQQFPDIKARIIARSNNYPGDWPNLEFMENVYGPVFERSIYDAAVVVMPLFDLCFSSGQLTLLIAMELGKPIIASDVPGVRDYITAGHDGVLVPAGDPGALASELKRLLDDPGERKRLGDNARVTHQTRYTQEMSQMAILREVKEVVREPGASPDRMLPRTS